MPLLFVLFIVVPIVELYVIIQVGQSIGVLPTIALLLVDSVVGAWLAKREGLRAWRNLTTAIQERRIPAREVADGALVLLGGALLLTPGFVTDAFGLLLLLPPSRAVIRRMLVGRFTPAPVQLGHEVYTRAQQRRRAPGPTGDVIEGEIVDES